MLDRGADPLHAGFVKTGQDGIVDSNNLPSVQDGISKLCAGQFYWAIFLGSVVSSIPQP
jgi:hypothetical protein